MNTKLSVEDPLADKEVTIIITVAASEQPRDQRPAMVSVGLAEQLPAIKTGAFDDVSALINEAWAAFGVRLQLAEAAAEGETVTEEQVVATASTEESEPVSGPQPVQVTPKPQARNLSLF